MSLVRFKTAVFLDQHYSIPLFSDLDVKLQTLKIILIGWKQIFFLEFPFLRQDKIILICLPIIAGFFFFFFEFIYWSGQRDLKKERHGKGKAEACSFHILWLEPRLLPHFNGEKPLLTSMSQGVI